MTNITILAPLLALLRNPSFVLAIVTFVVGVVTSLFPQLTDYRTELFNILTLLFSEVFIWQIAERWAAGTLGGVDKVIPLFDPLVELLKSRKFMLAVVGFVISVLLTYFPELESVRGDLQIILSVLVSALISSIGIGDVVRKLSIRRQIEKELS